MIKVSKTKVYETFSITGRYDLHDPIYYVTMHGFKDEEEQEKYLEMIKQLLENPQAQIDIKADAHNKKLFAQLESNYSYNKQQIPNENIWYKKPQTPTPRNEQEQ